MDIPHSIQSGLEHHQHGRLHEAASAYQEVLRVEPRNADALHLLGVVALQTGQAQQALMLITDAVNIAPTFAMLNNLGEAYRAIGRVDEAVACYTRSIQLNPRQADAFSNLALVHHVRSRFKEEIHALESAINQAPDRVDLFERLGDARSSIGDAFGAASAYQQALSHNPRIASASSKLGVALSKLKRFPQAIAAARAAVDLAPTAHAAHLNLGLVLESMSEFDDAITSYQRAIELEPADANGYGSLGTLLEKQNRIDEAATVLQQGTARIAKHPRLLNCLSSVLRKQRNYSAALRCADEATHIMPALADAHGNRALVLLALGRYEEGFVEYEWRWRCDGFTTASRDFKRPMWDGSDSAGRTVLVHSEQGFGDTIQFLRYVPMLAALGAKVIVEVNHALVALTRGVQGVTKVVPAGLNLPDFDLHVPLLSLPGMFKTTLENVPNVVPYLTIDASRVEAWRARIAPSPLNVGIIWAGNRDPDPNRNIAPELLEPLFEVKGCRWFSLQKREARTYSPPPKHWELLDLSPELTDFSETAAAMTNLDLVITIDTGPAHLAGALGRPTWTLLPWSPDWRWMLDRTDSVWYPTMRLFRQPSPGDWTATIQSVKHALEETVSRQGSASGSTLGQ